MILDLESPFFIHIFPEQLREGLTIVAPYTLIATCIVAAEKQTARHEQLTYTK